MNSTLSSVYNLGWVFLSIGALTKITPVDFGINKKGISTNRQLFGSLETFVHDGVRHLTTKCK